MLTARAIPCLLLQDERLVKTIQFRNPNYVGDPVNAIKIYNDKELDEILVLDIGTATGDREPSWSLLEDISGECFVPLAYGGGIRNLAHARKAFAIGIEKLCVNSLLIDNPNEVANIANTFGNQSLIASIDVHKSPSGYRCYTHGGRHNTLMDPISLVKRAKELGAGEILLNSIDRDGTWGGYDIELVRMVTASTDLPVIACGGASGIDDMVRVIKEGKAQAAGAGSLAVYQKKGMGVLIKFPRRHELDSHFAEHALS